MKMQEVIASKAVELGFRSVGDGYMFSHQEKNVYFVIATDSQLAEDLKNPDPEKYAIVRYGTDYGTGYAELRQGFMILSSDGKVTPSDWLKAILEK